VAVDHEQRPDQVVRGEHVFPHQPARPFRLAVAARPDRQIEAGRVAHFDRTPEFDRHVMLSPEAAGRFGQFFEQSGAFLALCAASVTAACRKPETCRKAD
jgi:hypothetical protein